MAARLVTVVALLGLVGSIADLPLDRAAGGAAGGPSGSGDASVPTASTSATTVLPLRVTPLRLATLRPGSSHALDLTIENPNPHTVLLTGVLVDVHQVTSARSTARHPCGLVDFRAHAGHFAAVELAPGADTTLAAAAVPAEQWPRVEMVESGANQDGCQGARLDLIVRVEGRIR